VLDDLNAALARRDGRLMGFETALENKAEIQR
jgi:hypothetical protein